MSAPMSMTRSKRHYATVLTAAALACLVLLGASTSSGEPTDRVVFVGVRLDDTDKADEKLQNYLEDKAKLSFSHEYLEYEEIIPRLVEWDDARDGIVVARTTPYVLVAAEMLGADLEVLATYQSKATGDTTYRSYYVVRKDEVGASRTPDSVITWLREPESRRRFQFHSKFSTSSYFLPSLHLRAHQIFNTANAVGPIAGIEALKAEENSSKALVRAVAKSEADFAAVWSGTRAHFLTATKGSPDARFAEAVEFIALPDELPNDLLVCSRSAPQALKERLLASIRDMTVEDMDVGDFEVWREFSGASRARQALSGLRQMARPRPVPVVVEVHAGSGSKSGTAMMVEAAEDAIRLSESELVLHDRDFHKGRDMIWTLEEIREGAARLTTTFSGRAGRTIEKQVFPISFQRGEPGDLASRIVEIIRTRLHRIRYVWPYSGNPPAVLRDSPLLMPAGSEVRVQRVTWVDPDRHDFQGGPIWDVVVRHASRYVHELDMAGSPANAMDLDPLSNVSFRVYQVRVAPESGWFRFATLALVILLALAAVSATLGLRRRAKAAAVPSHSGDAS